MYVEPVIGEYAVKGSLNEDQIEFVKTYIHVNCSRELLLGTYGLAEDEGDGCDISELVVKYQGVLKEGLIAGTYSMRAELEKGKTFEAGGAFELGIGFSVRILKSLGDADAV